MVEREPVMKRSCAFCQSDDREVLEEAVKNGEMSCKQLDKDMSWRSNTADRHYRNHMGQYHMAANPSCVICSNENRSRFEERFFADGSESEVIATELEIQESTVYHHMKHHFQPLVQRSAATEVAITVGNEITVLRSNVERLNGKLTELMDEGNVHEEGFVRNAVSLHKEVRESIKDLTKFQDQWGTMGEGSQVNQTINILNVELAKESPETWKRIKTQLQETVEGME
jgi:hypothetical protein|tara:strand:- start:575 stop:1258 length:684 start_codon:yes stop_codon:yes gene_type:complete